jgi:hypothetical protein
MSHNDPKSVSQPGWGVELDGHPHDLADWEQALKLPFDPWVHRQEDEFVLRWSGFSGLQTINEVRQSAATLMDELNGAMAVVHSTRPVRSKGITEFRSDGSRNKFAEIEEFRVRGRAVAEGVALGPDGQVRPPPPPQQSEVQQWLAVGEKQQALADALVYVGRTGWFDTFKTIESLEDWVGGEQALLNLNWVPKKKLKCLKRTANFFRHRPGGKHKRPPRPTNPQEAHQILATLIRNAFAKVGP